MASPQIGWLSTLLRRFVIFLESILDRHEPSGIAVQWNGGGGGGGLSRFTYGYISDKNKHRIFSEVKH